MDRDDDIMRAVIKSLDGKGICQRLADIQCLNSGLTVIGGVAPGSGGIDSKATVSAGDALRHKTRLPAIGIGDRQCAGGGDIARGNRNILGDTAGIGAAEGGGVA